MDKSGPWNSVLALIDDTVVVETVADHSPDYGYCDAVATGGDTVPLLLSKHCKVGVKCSPTKYGREPEEESHVAVWPLHESVHNVTNWTSVLKRLTIVAPVTSDATVAGVTCVTPDVGSWALEDTLATGPDGISSVDHHNLKTAMAR